MPAITKVQLQELVRLSESLPEEYRQKCFELLLAHALQLYSPKSMQEAPNTDEETKESPVDKPHILPIDVKTFLSQYDLDQALLWSFFIIDGTETRHIYKLKTTGKSQAQTQHALMMSLENAITTGQFEVRVENLRVRCKNEKCYDSRSFMKNIKNCSQLFEQVENVETLVLSPDGKSELADLLEELSMASRV